MPNTHTMLQCYYYNAKNFSIYNENKSQLSARILAMDRQNTIIKIVVYKKRD